MFIVYKKWLPLSTNFIKTSLILVREVYDSLANPFGVVLQSSSMMDYFLIL